MKILGLLLKIAYLFRRHFLFAVRMDLLLLGSLLIGMLFDFRAGQHTWGTILLIASLAWLMLMLFAHRTGYLVFHANPRSLYAAPPAPLKPDAVFDIKACGPFSIRDQVILLINHPIQYTTPRSREHILMTELKRSRLLLIGQTRDHEWGWWYQFIKPQTIIDVQAGQIIHGWRPQLGLQIRYTGEIKEGEPETLEAILIFEDQDTRNLVWEDLSRESREADATDLPADASQSGELGLSGN